MFVLQQLKAVVRRNQEIAQGRRLAHLPALLARQALQAVLAQVAARAAQVVLPVPMEITSVAVDVVIAQPVAPAAQEDPAPLPPAAVLPPAAPAILAVLASVPMEFAPLPPLLLLYITHRAMSM